MKSPRQILYRPEIDGLRAIAVLGVVFFHLGFGFHGGFVGVDVFFVISGYLITDIIRNEFLNTGTFNFSRFYIRRLRRLMPALFATLAVTWVFSFLLLSLSHFYRSNLALIYSSLSLSNLYFLSESGYFDGSSLLKPLLHTWSLGVEIQFYLIWPLLIFLLLRFTNKTKTITTVVALGFLSLIADILVLKTTVLPTFKFDEKALAFYFTPFRVYEFVIGGLLVWLTSYQPKSRSVAEGIFFCGLALIVAAIALFSEKTVFPGYNALIPCIGAACIIYSTNASSGKKILAFSPVRYIGKISYSLYLCHWPVNIFYRYYKTFYAGTNIIGADKYIMLGLSFVLSVVMYKYIETPFRFGHTKTIGLATESSKTYSHRRPFLYFGALSILLVSIALISLQNRGWPDRTSITPNLQKRYGNLENFFGEQWGGKDCGDGCEVNPSEKKRTWVIGDSHSMHLEPGLIKFFPHQNYKFIWNKCRFYSLEFCAADDGPPRAAAILDKQKTFEEIRGTSDNVIISHFWYAVNTSGYKNKNGTLLYSLDKNLEAFIATQVDELKKIKSYLPNNRVIVLGALPYFASENPSDCFTFPTFFTKKRSDCAKEAATLHKKFIDLNVGLAKGLKNSGIIFINPTEYFCDKEYCNTVDGDKILFADASHLSVDGSIYFVSKILDKLKLSPSSALQNH